MKNIACAGIAIVCCLCSCSKSPPVTNGTPAQEPPSTAEGTSTPAPRFAAPTYVVQALYGGAQETKADVTAKVAEMMRSGLRQIPVDAQRLGVLEPFAISRTLTISFSTPDGEQQLSADDGQLLTLPATAETVVNSRVAPPGIYFLTRHVGITTNDGIIGLNPGTELKVLKDNGISFHVTNGPNEFEVEKAVLTNDLYVARAAANQDAALMGEINQMGARQARAAADAQAAFSASTAKAQRQVAVTQAPAPAANPLDKGSYDRHAGVTHGFW